MSIKLMAQVWEKDLSHSEQSILLAMADYADDDGRNCYPSHERIAWKTGYSTRQVTRIIKELCAKGILFILKPSTQHQSTHYWIRLNKATAKTPYRVDVVSSLNDEDDNSVDKLSSLNDSSIDMVSSLGDENDIQGRQMEHPGWTNETSSIDMVSTDPSVNHQEEPIREEEQTQARDPLSVAWHQAYADIEMPPKLATSLQELSKECGIPAAIHGIKASALKSDGRNFRYIAECARNYVPPAPMATYAKEPGYQVDLPGVHLLEPPATNGHSPPAPLPPPIDHDDPWAVALAELSGVLPGSAPHWLEGSRLVASGEIAGEPLYRVVLTNPRANAQWLTQQAEPAVRKKLASLLRKRILLEFVNAPQEVAA